jgi:threonine dehydratase
VPVGGGGLIPGLAGYYAGRVKVIGVEPVGAATLAKVLEAGRPVDVDVSGLAADSLGATSRRRKGLSNSAPLRRADRAGH